MKKGMLKKGLAGILTAAMVAGFAPAIGNDLVEVKAEGTSEIRNVNLDTDYLLPSYGRWETEWNGTPKDHKVYFGAYNKKPTAFRVLNDNVKETMLLDCDGVLLNKAFNEDSKNANVDQAAGKPNGWQNSDLDKWLNGSEYYGNNNVFSLAERSAIVFTKLMASDGEYNPVGTSSDSSYDKNAIDYMAEDYVFLLSAQEANELYGGSIARRKYDSEGIHGWWLRTSNSKDIYQNYAFHVEGSRWDEVTWGNIYVCSVEMAEAVHGGVSPALNLDTSAIRFTSLSGADKSASFAETVSGSTAKEWNLTLAGGEGFEVEVLETAVKDKITVNVSSLGNKLDGTAADADYYSQISAMLVDENGTVIAYGKVGGANEVGKDITFDIPDTDAFNLKDLELKVFAEKVNSSKSNNATDYASNMVSVPITTKDVDLVSVVNPDELVVENGTAYADMGLPSKVKATANPVVEELSLSAEDGKYTVLVPVEWDTENPAAGSYDPEKQEEQKVTLNGELALPEYINNPDELAAQINIRILEAKKEVLPEEPKPEEPKQDEPKEPAVSEKVDAVKTGDEAPFVWMLILMIVSGTIMAVQIVNRRKKA